MIIIKNVNKTYSDQTKALIDINLEIPSKGLYFILGKSGSGKTTLLNLLSALDKPDSGNILVDDLDITQLKEKQSTLYRSNNIGFVFQQYNLIERWTVERNIAFSLELAGKPVNKDEIRKVCAELGLLDDNDEPLVNKRVANLSGGQKQRVAIARAIIKKPKILLCDEPTGALDKNNAKYLLNTFKKLSEDTCVIVVTHDKTIIDKENNVIEMANGKVISNSIHANKCSDEQCTLGKPKTTFSNLFSLAINFLTASKFRLGLSFLLLTVCLFAFSVPTVGSSQTDLDVISDTLISHDEKYAVIANTILEEDSYISSPFNDKQNEIIKQYNGFENINVYQSLFDDSKYYNSYSLNTHPYKYLLGTSFSQVMEIPTDFDLSKIGVIKDPRLDNSTSCRMPEAINEIAISDLQADKLLKQGYIADYEHSPTTFENINEIVGSYLGEFLITGIYQTCDSKDLFSDYADSKVNDEIMLLARGTYFSKTTFMLKGSMETIYKNAYPEEELTDHSNEYLPSMSLIKTKNKSEMKKLCNALENANEESHIAINCKYNHIIEKTSFLRNSLGKRILWIATGVTAAFAFVSMSFMFFVEFDIKKKELGIISTLGAPRNYICKLLLIESLVVGSISLVLSLISITLFSAIINAKMMYVVLKLNTFSLLFIILFTYLLMMMISFTIYLVHHKKKSIDLIKEY